MRLFVFSSALIIGLNASAAVSKSISVEYSYSRSGNLICSGTKKMESGSTYLACDSSEDGDKIQLKLTATAENSSQIKVSAYVDKIAADGKIVEASRPTIIVLAGEKSYITESDQDGNILTQIEVTASLQ